MGRRRSGHGLRGSQHAARRCPTHWRGLGRHGTALRRRVDRGRRTKRRERWERRRHRRRGDIPAASARRGKRRREWRGERCRHRSEGTRDGDRGRGRRPRERLAVGLGRTPPRVHGGLRWVAAGRASDERAGCRDQPGLRGAACLHPSLVEERAAVSGILPYMWDTSPTEAFDWLVASRADSSCSRRKSFMRRL